MIYNPKPKHLYLTYSNSEVNSWSARKLLANQAAMLFFSTLSGTYGH